MQVMAAYYIGIGGGNIWEKLAMVGQMQKLRQLQMAQLQAQNTVALAEQGRKGASDEWMRKYMNQKYDRRPLSERIKD